MTAGGYRRRTNILHNRAARRATVTCIASVQKVAIERNTGMDWRIFRIGRIARHGACYLSLRTCSY